MTVPEPDDNESNTMAKIKQHQDNIKMLNEKEKKLTAIKAKCDHLVEHNDVRPLTESLSEQLTITIEVIRNQLQLVIHQITVLETHLNRLRAEAVTPVTSDTIGSSPMPEHEASIHDTQTSESLRTPEYPENVAHIHQQTSLIVDKVPAVDTVDTSIQTRDNKPTENILVSQTVSDGGHQTIKFESTPNPIISEQMEDVYVDAKYQQPNDPHKTTELVLRNVPQTSFETTFVEPDDTTTEVVIDADGKKTIIVRKMTRTVQQHRLVEHRQQFTEVQSIVGADNQPIEQTVAQINTQNQSVCQTVSDASGSKAISVHQSQALFAKGDSLDKLVVQEVIESEPVIHISESGQPAIVHSTDIVVKPSGSLVEQESQSKVEHSSIQTVVHHVTKRIIRRKKKIIRRVTIIDGEEHVTEEVIEEPEEIEESENEIPNVNVNIIRNTIIKTEGETQPIIELAADEPQEIDHMPQPVDIVAQNVTVEKQQPKQKSTEGKQEQTKSRKTKEQKDIQVFEIEPTAPVVDLAIENAQVEPALLETTIDVVNIVQLPAQTIEIETRPEPTIELISENIVLSPEPEITNINQIWPPDDPSDLSLPASHTSTQSIEIRENVSVQPSKDESLPSQEIWPLDDKTGHTVVLDTYTFEKESPTEDKEPTQQATPAEMINITEIQVKESPVIIASPEREESPQYIQIQKVVSQTSESASSPIQEPNPEVTQTITTTEVISPIETVIEESSSKTYSIHDDKPMSDNDNKDKKKKKKINKKNKTSESTVNDDKSQPQSIPKADENIDIDIRSSVEEMSQGIPVSIEIQTTKIIDVVNVVSPETETPVDTVNEPVIIVEEVKSEENLMEQQPKEEIESASLQKPTIDVRTATQLFIDNELNVSDATTRTVKVSLTPKESTSPGSLVVKMKLEQSEQPNLQVNIVEESVILPKEETPEVVESEIDPSVAQSVELDISDDNTISEKMEMPEIEPTPIQIEVKDKPSVNTEHKSKISPDESYKTISELQSPVNVMEEAVLSPDSDTPKPIGAELVIPTEILEEQQLQDAQQQTSPTEITETVKVDLSQIEKPIVDSRSMQTSPEVKVDAVQQTSPVHQVDDGNQTEVFVTEIHVQTSPIPIGNVEEMSHKPTETTTEEIQTDEIPKTATSEKSMQVEVAVRDEQTSPRSDANIQQESVDVQFVVPQVTDKLVSDVIQSIPIQIQTNDEQTTTEILQTSEIDTQTSLENITTQPAFSEPIEIHIQTAFHIPENVSVNDEPGVLEINKSFVIDDEVKKPQKSILKKKKMPKSKTASEQFIEIESQQLPSDATLVQSTSIEEVQESPREEIIIATEPQDESEKPTLVTLNITKTTVYDTTNVVGAEQKVIEEEIISKQNRSPGSVSSVTIEEILTPTEEQFDVPVTPGADNINESQTSWNEQLQAVNVQSESPIAEVIQMPSTSVIITTEPHEHHQWVQTIDVINDRIKNIQNAQKTHLSNVLHLTSLTESVNPETIQHRASAIEDNLKQLEDATSTKNTVIIHQTVIKIVEEISTWLETIEYRVYLNRQNSGDSPTGENFDGLLNELGGIASNVQNLSKSLEKADKIVSPAEHQKMVECLDNLKKQINAVESVTNDSNDEIQSNIQRWTEYITIVETINITIVQLQSQFDDIQNDDLTIGEQLQRLDDLERKNNEQIEDINRSMQIARSLARDFPNTPIPLDIHASYENARNFENTLALERNRLLQLQSLAEDYEQTLNQFAQIILLAEKMVERRIEAESFDELQQEMQKHRKFFINLNHCRTILESLKENIDTDSRKKNNDLHNSLHEKATQILDKASERSQRISMAASKWTVLEKNLSDEKQWLQMAQQRVPNSSEVSTVDYERYITMYKSICSDVNQHHARLIHLTNLAIQLQDLVETSTIQEECNDSLATLLKLNDELKIYLDRLTAFKDVWTTYEMQTDRLEQWILQSERELSQIEVPKDLRVQPNENTRRFWEIRVHYEVNNNLRNEIGNTFERSLEILPFRDELMQRQFHQQLEDRWANVSNKIESIQAAIVNGLSSQDMPIDEKLELLRRELDELRIAVASTKSVIKNEEELNIYIERMQLLNNRLTVVYNELGRLSLLPTHDPEQIGELFALSQTVSVPVSEEIENSLILKSALRNIRNGIKRMRQTQENNLAISGACESSEKMDSDQIELAVVDCQHLATELAIQWQEIMHLRQLLHTLPMRLRVSVSPVKLERDLSQLQDNHAEQEARCTQILNLLKNRLSLWKRFERQLEIVQQTNNETDFMIDLLKVNGQVDYERLKKTTERLEVSFYDPYFRSFFSFIFILFKKCSTTNVCKVYLEQYKHKQYMLCMCMYINDPSELMLGNAMNIPFLNTKLLTRNFFSLLEFGILFGKHWGINQKSIQNKQGV